MLNRVLRRLCRLSRYPWRKSVGANKARLLAGIEHKQRASMPILLNLGCGSRIHPEWINIDFAAHENDVLKFDLSRPLPVSDGVADMVYASHVLEHFTPNGARQFLNECRRLLKPGGILRLVVPDLEAVVREYLFNLEKARQGDAAAAARYEWIVIELLDQMVRHRSGGMMRDYWLRDTVPAEDYVIQRVGKEYLRARAQLAGASPVPELEDVRNLGLFRASGEVHQWMYDSHSLQILLTRTGFENATQTNADVSRYPDFIHFNLDLDREGMVYKPDSLFMEAIRKGDE